MSVDTGSQFYRSVTTKESSRMTPAFRLHQARSRPRGVSRRMPRVGLLAVLTGLLVLLPATSANAATIVEGWGASDAIGLEGIANTGLVAPTTLPLPEEATAAAVGSYENGQYGNAFV